MARFELGRHGLVLVALGCFGCDEPLPADGASENTNPGSAGDGGVTWQPLPTDGGWLVSGDAGHVTIALPTDSAVEVKLRVDAGTDAGVKGDAGQDAGGDAAVGVQPDAGDAGAVPTDVPNCATVYYADKDGDGFGDSKLSLKSCFQPIGYALVGGDCYDGNERAFPGARGQFMADRGDGSYDYDCDGVQTLARTVFASCPSLINACPPVATTPNTPGAPSTPAVCDDHGLSLTFDGLLDAGWTDFRQVKCDGEGCPRDVSKVPACGETGQWGISVSWLPVLGKYVCLPPLNIQTRIQTCH